MSNTPETDRQWANWLQELKNPIESFVNFARKLERERDNLLDQREFAISEIKRLKRERDEARKAFAIATDECVVAQAQLRKATRSDKASDASDAFAAPLG